MLIGAKITLRKLMYDDSGVAMAYTVLVSLFIFMLCVSTYAMSENIRQKMELQNACDAAAYSGAVVQADMLSRIAVLNRALAWTYFQTSKRNMDYIISDWINEIERQYDYEKAFAEISIRKKTISHTWRCETCGADGIIRYERRQTENGVVVVPIYCSTCGGEGKRTDDYTVPGETRYGLRNWHICFGCGGDHGQANNFSDSRSSIPPAGWFMGHNLKDCVFINNSTEVELRENFQLPATPALTTVRDRDIPADIVTQLDNGYENIRTINAAIDSLKLNMNIFISNAIKQCMETNDVLDTDFQWNAGNGWGNDDTIPPYFQLLTSERDFLNCIGASSADFRTGSGTWWVVREDSERGISREYVGGQDLGNEDIPLTAEFRGWATVWARNPYTGLCENIGTTIFFRRVWQINPTCAEYFQMPYARPVQVANNFFGKDGTVVVAAKKSMVNPFEMIFGENDSNSGLYGAFNGTKQDMWTVSTARAGLRFNTDSTGNYRVQWPETHASQYNTNNVWNLCEEDWDAVMLPVARAWNDTTTNAWGSTSIDTTTSNLLNSARTALGVSTPYTSPVSRYNPFNPGAVKR